MSAGVGGLGAGLAGWTSRPAAATPVDSWLQFNHDGLVPHALALQEAVDAHLAKFVEANTRHYAKTNAGYGLGLHNEYNLTKFVDTPV